MLFIKQFLTTTFLLAAALPANATSSVITKMPKINFDGPRTTTDWTPVPIDHMEVFPVRIATNCGVASWYGLGDGFAGKRTASGQRFDPYAMTTAHRSLPFGTRIRVTNQSNGKSVLVTGTDRGPYVAGRILDLSYGAFARIAHPDQGTARVCYSRV
jgi:rare lipoprotein A